MGPLVRFVRLKTKMLSQRSALMEQHSALLENMRDAVGLQDVLALVPQLDAIELEVEKASQPIAFRGRNDEQWAFCLAADYADEWPVVRRPDGSIKCAFRSLHKCTAKAGEADGCCGTVIGNKAWLRKLPVPWASGQKWYCNRCYAKYRTTMCMLTEIRAADGSVYWIVSEFPGGMRDVNWMAVEDQYKEARTPQYLYNMIQAVVSYTGDGFLRPATPADCWTGGSSVEGVCKVVNVPLMRSMPVWGFLEIVAFAEAI